MRRREFITLLGSAAAAWPLAARAQQPKVPVVGFLHPGSAEPNASLLAAFRKGLAEAGYTEGKNVVIEFRWAHGENSRLGEMAVDLDTTGFTLFEYGISAKWLELLKEIAPGVTRAAVIREGTNPAGIGQFAAIQSVAPSHGVQVSSVVVRDGSEIERAVDTLARSPNSGLIVTASGLRDSDGHLIVTLAARYRLPAVYPFPSFVTDGGLICYGPSSTDQYRRAAQYVDRILKGEKPSELVQAPNKYELVVNLKTAKALGLEMPTTVLARADEVIE